MMMKRNSLVLRQIRKGVVGFVANDGVCRMLSIKKSRKNIAHPQNRLTFAMSKQKNDKGKY